MVTLAEWTTNTNTRAILLNAGVLGRVYPEFKPFTPMEIKQFIGLYILQGLSPSPQLKLKFHPQNEDPINGSDLCYKVFEKNADKCHKHFKAFFTLQNSLKQVPSKKTHSNFKVDPFLTWIQTISIKAWNMGRNLLTDEQTASFKRNHADKQRISYKKEGDGFLGSRVSLPCCLFCV